MIIIADTTPLHYLILINRARPYPSCLVREAHHSGGRLPRAASAKNAGCREAMDSQPTPLD